jgi:esterase/lipase
MDAPANRAKAVQTWEQSRIAFLKAITNIPYIRTVKIPYQKTNLPGYFITTKAKNAPLLIVNTGFDGTDEELYFAVGLAAHKRGYNVLLVEGPGQGEVIKLQGIPFRYDWEQVVTPIINFSDRLPNVDHSKIALMGLSMGGYLAARAAAFEPRLNAIVLNGGVYSVLASVTSSMPSDFVNLAYQKPSQFNSIVQKQMTEDTNASWFFNNASWVFKAKTPADVIKTLKNYTLEDVIDKIKCATLVIDSADDQFFKNQPQQVYDQLKAPKKLIHFTAQETAQAHCQAGAIAISNEYIFNWLDQTLNWHPRMIN